MPNKFQLPYLGYGLGLRPQHYEHIITHKPNIDWFEVISENYINRKGLVRAKLNEIRSHYPVVMHGVSLSIGSAEPLSKTYLQSLKNLADEINPVWISDHLCFTGINGKNTHDLLPVPLTKEMLAHIVPRIKQVQDFLGRPLLLENPSSYLTYRADEIAEYDFMAELAEKADCALLLDVNNIYVSAYNQRISADSYLNALPANRVVQIHLAGHQNAGTHIVDTHDSPVNDNVWQLYAKARTLFGDVSTMIEWDSQIPEFPVLEAEVNKARSFTAASITTSPAHKTRAGSNSNFNELQQNLQTTIFSGNAENADTWIEPKENLPPHEQAQIYINAYRLRLAESILQDYPKTAEFLGEEIKPIIKDYIENTRSTYPDLAAYSWDFADVIKNEQAALIADIERKTAKCFELQNSPAATANDFTKMTEDEFLQTNMAPRKASYLIARSHSQFAVYLADTETKQLELEENEFKLLSELNSGKNIGDALEALQDDVTPEQIQQWFAKWLEAELISIN